MRSRITGAALALVVACLLAGALSPGVSLADSDPSGLLSSSPGVLESDGLGVGRLGYAPLAGDLALAMALSGEVKPQGRFGIQERPDEPRALGHALWRSAVLPGWGQRYLGARQRSWIFFGLEAGIWTTWGIFKVQEHKRRETYIDQAQIFAGVQSRDHADDYWKAVGQHGNWLDYNEWLRYQGRREYGFGTDEYYRYIAENEIAASSGWEWGNDDRQLAYAEKRKASLNAERRATYTLYGFLINRVIAVVDTWRLWRTRESIREQIGTDGAGFGLQAFPAGEGLGWRLSWTRNF